MFSQREVVSDDLLKELAAANELHDHDNLAWVLVGRGQLQQPAMVQPVHDRDFLLAFLALLLLATPHKLGGKELPGVHVLHLEHHAEATTAKLFVDLEFVLENFAVLQADLFSMAIG